MLKNTSLSTIVCAGLLSVASAVAFPAAGSAQGSKSTAAQSATQSKAPSKADTAPAKTPPTVDTSPGTSRKEQLDFLFATVRRLEVLKPMLLSDVQYLVGVPMYEHNENFYLAREIKDKPYYEVEASRYELPIMFGVKLQIQPQLAVTPEEVAAFQTKWRKEDVGKKSVLTADLIKQATAKNRCFIHHKISDLQFDFDTEKNKPTRLRTISICTHTKPGEYPLHFR